ncbi:MAG: hypothetical protein ACOC85_04985 [Thermoplasmatota archaeon]
MRWKDSKCPNCRDRMELLIIDRYPKSIICKNCGYISTIKKR